MGLGLLITHIDRKPFWIEITEQWIFPVVPAKSWGRISFPPVVPAKSWSRIWFFPVVPVKSWGRISFFPVVQFRFSRWFRSSPEVDFRFSQWFQEHEVGFRLIEERIQDQFKFWNWLKLTFCIYFHPVNSKFSNMTICARVYRCTLLHLFFEEWWLPIVI